MSSRALAVLVVVGGLLVACGGDDKGGSTSSSGGSSGSSGGSSGSSSGTPDAGSTSSSSGASGTTPKAIDPPALTELMKMTGSLHVIWNLPAASTKCDTIEGERKSATEEYKVVWTTPGTVDNKHDGTATADTTYTYRLRCKIGADYSAYSNEMSKNPKQ
jgi:hypothetical protein